MPRPLSDAFTSLRFTLVKSPNNKYTAVCNICQKTLCNTAAARLRAHRNRCRLDHESMSDYPASSSLIIKSCSESSHDYTKRDPLKDLSIAEETQVETTNVYPSDNDTHLYGNFDDVDMRVVSVDSSKDECAAFGHYVATQLRKMDSKTCALVKFKICETLFNAEMGNLFKDPNT